jgi:cytoskeletal protein CcmA (bactofilin family)
MPNDKAPAIPVRTEIPRRGMEAPVTPRRRPDLISQPEASRDLARKLIVGRDISLAGEITACDHLVVEGNVEAKLKDCRIIEIADSGTFKGSASIGEASIAGRFEGELTVATRLSLRATGVISGTVRYGELEIEAGGRVVGSMEPTAMETRVAQPEPEPVMAFAGDAPKGGGETVGPAGMAG